MNTSTATSQLPGSPSLFSRPVTKPSTVHHLDYYYLKWYVLNNLNVCSTMKDCRAEVDCFNLQTNFILFLLPNEITVCFRESLDILFYSVLFPSERANRFLYIWTTCFLNSFLTYLYSFYENLSIFILLTRAVRIITSHYRLNKFLNINAFKLFKFIN